MCLAYQLGYGIHFTKMILSESVINSKSPWVHSGCLWWFEYRWTLKRIEWHHLCDELHTSMRHKITHKLTSHNCWQMEWNQQPSKFWVFVLQQIMVFLIFLFFSVRVVSRLPVIYQRLGAEHFALWVSGISTYHISLTNSWMLAIVTVFWLHYCCGGPVHGATTMQ